MTPAQIERARTTLRDEAARGFFPDEGGDAEYAGGIDLLNVGQNAVQRLKEKYKNYRPTIHFEGW